MREYARLAREIGEARWLAAEAAEAERLYKSIAPTVRDAQRVVRELGRRYRPEPLYRPQHLYEERPIRRLQHPISPKRRIS